MEGLLRVLTGIVVVWPSCKNSACPADTAGTRHVGASRIVLCTSQHNGGTQRGESLGGSVPKKSRFADRVTLGPEVTWRPRAQC